VIEIIIVLVIGAAIGIGGILAFLHFFAD